MVQLRLVETMKGRFRVEEKRVTVGTKTGGVTQVFKNDTMMPYALTVQQLLHAVVQ